MPTTRAGSESTSAVPACLLLYVDAGPRFTGARCLPNSQNTKLYLDAQFDSFVTELISSQQLTFKFPTANVKHRCSFELLLVCETIDCIRIKFANLELLCGMFYKGMHQTEASIAVSTGASIATF